MGATSGQGRTEKQLLDSITGSLAQADECADRTMGALDEQTNQLHRIKRDADIIDSNLDQSEHLLRGLKPGGWFRNLFRKDPTPTAVPRPSTKSNSNFDPARRTAKTSTSSGTSNSSTAPAGGQGAQKLLEKEAARRASAASQPGQNNKGEIRPDLQRDTETEKAYDDIENLLSGLKEKGRVINRTLDNHNKMLPGLVDDITKAQDRITRQSKDMNKFTP